MTSPPTSIGTAPSTTRPAGRSHPPPRRSGAWSATSYALIALLTGIAWVCLFVLNRTKVQRAGRLPPQATNILFVSNHQSTVDTLLVGFATCHPRCWLDPRLLPWSLAAAEVYFRTPVTTWFADHLRCIPLRRDRRDPAALRRIVRELSGGVAIYFPEGRRSRSGVIGQASLAAGWIALLTGARVVPVAVDGMNQVVRFERFGLRFFQRIGVSVGPELDLSAYRGHEPSREAAQEVTDLMMAAIERELVRARAARRDRSERESGT